MDSAVVAVGAEAVESAIAGNRSLECGMKGLPWKVAAPSFFGR